ncbi:redoxin family protein [Flavivirga amylovorans]|uniref:Redoxin family protein n=1 Tax=Flavivirga amylovorans TaxID=870486 RepID=A0ABT8X1B8_9FLAO|nr:redoxin family protein [Flavivirga amylovorans]MDO5987517.1 redoxin family protein [Flavivirga amylovorans]
MKKQTIIKVFALLLFGMSILAYASSNNNGKIAFNDNYLSDSFSKEKIEKLKVGDPAPPISAFKWIKGQPYKNGKLPKGKVYIIEFTATWCAPCLAAVPHVTNLTNKYKNNDVEVLSFFILEQNVDKEAKENSPHIRTIETFIQKHGAKMDYNVAIDALDKTMEKNWFRASGRPGIPTTIIIDKEGLVSWVGSTSHHEEIDQFISYIISDNYSIEGAMGYDQKANPSSTYDSSKLLLLNGNGGGKEDDFMYRSLIRKSIRDIEDGRMRDFVSSRHWFGNLTSEIKSRYRKGRMQFENMGLFDLYHLAFGDTLANAPLIKLPNGQFVDTITYPYLKTSYAKFWYEPILEVGDPSKFEPTKWSDRRGESGRLKFIKLGKLYDYSVQVPKEKASAKFIQEVMQRDLKNYFGYDVSIEIRQMPVWKFTADDRVRVKTPGEQPKSNWKEKKPTITISNFSLFDFIQQLALIYGYQYYDSGLLSIDEQFPFVNATGLKEVDISIPSNWQKDFHGLRKHLREEGLYLEKSTHPMKVIVIRDPKVE